MRQFFRLTSFLLELLRGQQRFARLGLMLTVVISIVGGASVAALFSVINAFLGGRRYPRLWLAFVGLLVVRVVLRLVSQYMIVRMTQTALLQLRLWLCRQILSTPLRRLEELGSPRLMAGLTADVGNVSQALVTLPSAFVNITMLLGFAGYLGWLSPLQLLQTIGVAVIGVITFRLPLRLAMQQQTRARDMYDQLAKYFRALIDGAKELKMHSDRRKEFMSGLESSARSQQKEVRAADMVLVGLSSWAEALFFIAVALVLFVGPLYQVISPTVLIGYVVVILMLRGPVEGLINLLPTLSQGAVSINKLQNLSSSVAATAVEGDGVATHAKGTFSKLEVSGIAHQYLGESDLESFTLGPASFTIHSGELVFIIGGNGSGKTTLAKILAGLYAPEKGEVRLDGIPVTDQNRDWYRQNFTAVFSDFFLFDSLFGLEGAADTPEAKEYLHKLALAEKLKVRNGVFSTIDLSQGQRKRLALFIAYLENRPVYIFDEWAADQDPRFKEVFYRSLLPGLRANGKTVIVITHDDSYYNMADRIIKLTAGKIEFDGNLREYLSLLEAVNSEAPLVYEVVRSVR
jgi:putative pyoverdin transport system ATP-binding/permease protein